MIEVNGKRFMCDECPMIWGLEQKLEIADKYGVEPQIEYCGCDKTGNGKFYIYGFCEDAFDDRDTCVIAKAGKRNSGRAYRRLQKEKKIRERRTVLARYGYRPMLGHIECSFVNGVWQETGTHIKYPKSSNAQKFLKRKSNRAVRRYKGEIPNGNSYRKIEEYWWALF